MNKLISYCLLLTFSVVFQCVLGQLQRNMFDSVKKDKITFTIWLKYAKL